MRGILSWSAYLPYRRLDRTRDRAVRRSGRRQGHPHRRLASTRTPPRWPSRRRASPCAAPRPRPRAAAVRHHHPRVRRQDQRHRHPRRAAAARHDGRVRLRGVGALGGGRAPARARPAADPALVVSADVRTGLPGQHRGSGRGDAAAAFVVGATPTGRSSPSWSGSPASPTSSSSAGARPASCARRSGTSGSARSATCPLGGAAWNAALESAGLTANDVDRWPRSPRPASAVARARSGGKLDGVQVIDDLLVDRRHRRRRAARDCCSPRCSSRPSPVRSSRCVVLADGADVLLFRATDAIASYRAGARRSRRSSLPAAPLPYGKFLAWKGVLPVEPPRRARTATGVGHRRGAQRRLEVRLRRLEGARHRRGARAARARVARRRAHRRDGAGAARRQAGHDRDVHRRPPGVLAEPADRVRGRRLRRRRAAARSSSPTSTRAKWRSASGSR